jgi:hypothetical protein
MGSAFIGYNGLKIVVFNQLQPKILGARGLTKTQTIRSELSPRGLCDFGPYPHYEELTLTTHTKLQAAHRQHTLSYRSFTSSSPLKRMVSIGTRSLDWSSWKR